MNKKNKRSKKNLHLKTKWFPVGGVILIIIAIVAVLLLRNEENTEASFTPINSIRDVHGLAIDPNEPEILYVATHNGLVRGVNDADWAIVGSSRSDFMGFSLHPDGETMYSSGHPATGGNIGVAMSTDKGQRWKTIALAKQVDFHSMVISPANPKMLYGWHGNRLYKSIDGGQQWNNPRAANLSQVFSFAPDPFDEQVLWAATARGLLKSRDSGDSFSITSFPSQTITAVSVDPSKSNVMYVWIAGQGLFRSNDHGENWQNIDSGIKVTGQDAVGQFAIDPTNPRRIYAATFSAAIYKSLDGGETWELIKRR